MIGITYILGAMLMYSYVNLLQIHFKLPRLYSYAPLKVMRDHQTKFYWATIFLWPISVLVMLGCTLFGWTPDLFYAKDDAKDDADGST